MFKTSLILFLALVISACSNHRIRVDQGVLIEQETLQYLQAGLHQEQVRKLIGPPANISSFKPNRWEYTFHTNMPDTQVGKVKMLIVEFDDKGYLLNWKKL